ncbi:hypothetical protein RKD42_005400 [Streptomyces ambofaciens]
MASIASRTSSESTVSAAASWECRWSRVRGPTSAAVTAGCAVTKPSASWIRVRPASSATAASFSTASSLARLAGPRGVETLRQERRPVRGDLPPRAHRAGQPSGGERAPHQHAEPVLLGHGQDVALDPALEHGVAGLLGDVPAEAVLAGGPLGLDDAVGGVGRGAEVPDLPGALQIGERGQGLLVTCLRVPAVDLVEVHVVDAEAAQAVVQLGDQPATRGALVVGLVAHRHACLRGQHDVVPAPGDRLADHLLRLAAAVHVGGVDQVDPRLQGGVDEGGGLLLGGAPDAAEVHGAERERADLHTGAAQGAVLHDGSSTGVACVGVEA